MATKTKLRAQRVKELFETSKLDCDPILTKVVKTEGVIAPGKVEFDGQKLKSIKQEICDMLAQLPNTFFRNADGDGFYRAFKDRHNRQWTSKPEVVDQLVTLGVAVGVITFTAPREIWSAMPQGATFRVSRS